MLNFPFSAALLAGGQSRRMGQDKAALMINGTTLWERQISLLAELHPAQLFICGRPDGPYVGERYEVVTDMVPNAGPLGGLVTALRHASTEILLLVAVDMPAIQASFLERLLCRAHATSRCVIPSTDDGIEPLVAVYRTECLEKAEQQLRTGQRAMRRLVAELIGTGMAEIYPLSHAERPFFLNVNTPSEFVNFKVQTGDDARNEGG